MTSDSTHVVVVGASGNVGTSLIDALENDAAIGSVRALASRAPSLWANESKVRWATADMTRDDLETHFRDADVVIHLAWLFQPTHDPITTWGTNVLGSVRVFEAVAAVGVPTLIYGSSVGAYSPGPKDVGVDEYWPTHGWPGAAYTREKAYLERYLDVFEKQYPETRVVRFRPGFMFKRESASQQRRLFAGPFLPNQLVRPELLPVIPDLPGLRFPVLHTEDAAEAFRLAIRSSARGPFNLAAEPVLDASVLANLFRARPVPVPGWVVRSGLSLAWHAHLVPASPGLFDAALRLPILDTTRAHAELGWSPRRSSTEAILEFTRGLRGSEGRSTPPLEPEIPGGRKEEIKTGVGSRT